MKSTRYLFLKTYVERRQRRRRALAILTCIVICLALMSPLLFEEMV